GKTLDIATVEETEIEKIFVKPDTIEPLEETIEAIKMADIVIIGPGSLYTSVIPNLLVNRVEYAIKENRGRKFYIGNIMTQPGETDGYTQADHIRAIERHQKNKDRRLFEFCILNSGKLPEPVAKEYRRYHSQKVEIGEKLNDYTYVTDDFIILEDGRIRHDADLLARRIFETYVNCK
ncbi:MAG: 2-phospho-L-lactate transferase CofD family protein, partial [Eubacterium sp.]